MGCLKWNKSTLGTTGRVVVAFAVCLQLTACGLFKRPPPIDYFRRDMSFSRASAVIGGMAVVPVTSVPDHDLAGPPGEDNTVGAILSEREVNSLRIQLASRHENLEVLNFSDFLEPPLRPILLEIFQNYSYRDFLTQSELDLLRELSNGRVRYVVFAKLIEETILENDLVGSGEDDSGTYSDYEASTTVVVDFTIFDLETAALVWSGEITETESKSYREYDYGGGFWNIVGQVVGNILFSANPPPRSEVLDESYHTFARHLFSVPEGEEELTPTTGQIEVVTRTE